MTQNFDEPCPNCFSISAANNEGEVPDELSCQACGGEGAIPFDIREYLKLDAIDKGDCWLIDYKRPLDLRNKYGTKRELSFTVDKATYLPSRISSANWVMPNSGSSGLPHNANTVLLVELIVEDTRLFTNNNTL